MIVRFKKTACLIGLSFFWNYFVSGEYTLSTIDQRFKVTSPSLSLTHSLLLSIEQAGNDFDSLLGDQKDWKSPIFVIITTNFSQEKGFTRQVKITPKGLTFTLKGNYQDLFKDEFFSSLSELLCYELSFRDIEDFEQDSLSVLPFWLVDGIGQTLNRACHEDMLRLVKGVVKKERAPTLLTLQAWQEPERDILFRWYQKAFDFYAVRELTHRLEDRRALGNWFRQSLKTSAEKPLVYWTNLVAGGRWWSVSLQRGTRQPHEIFLDYELTRSSLEKVLTMEFKIKNKNQIITFKDLWSIPRGAEFFMFLKQKQKSLWQIIERGDGFYQPVLQSYYLILNDLLVNKITREIFEKKVEAAENLKNEVETKHEAIKNYLNWFEVTQFRTMPELEFYDFFNWSTQWEAKEEIQQLKERENLLSILNWQR